ncbi:cysteine proteinase [Nadsonia fulvescens var. elongata DSM 6958]|uniref:Cysteine proteinase n=1 Tax=Nadsonia fulvescens var. elongata DSM 6958 TaxID=857566 RepID=A0A1E3PD54_9ASCO|nr:cysteine proteinase [Nadsonia fulvescens var. elongata DSM 6958]
MISTIYTRQKGFHIPRTPLFQSCDKQFKSSSGNSNNLERPGAIATCGFEDIPLPAQTALASQNSGHEQSLSLFKLQPQSSVSMSHTLSQQLRIREGGIIFEYYDVTIYRGDLDNLRDRQWLNDNNISFVYEFLTHELISPEAETIGSTSLLGGLGVGEEVKLLKPAMVCLLASYADPCDLRDVLPPLVTSKFIFLPINDTNGVAMSGTGDPSGSHWSLLMVSVNDTKSFYYDTSLDRSGEGGNIPQARHVTEQLSKLLDVNLTFITVNTPQQTNSDDCGILVCEISALLLKRLVKAAEDENKAIDLGLEGVTLLATAGRSFITAAILQLITIYKERKG